MIVLHWAQRIGVELTLANLQLATSTVSAGVEQLQRLGRELAIDDRLDDARLEDGGLWRVNERQLREEMLSLTREYPELLQLAGEELAAAAGANS